ncbi:MAG: choline/carnitine O-acyltransferase [Sulfitobacter sp.]|nr:choline/carnitine O-acyltransferase [Sulfitobacter sp.]
MTNAPATFDLYSQLPRLPLPALEKTCARYLKTVRPLLNDADFAQAKVEVAELLASDGIGQRLQADLAARAASTENWLSDWWDDVAYLSVPDPIVVNVSTVVIGDPEQPQNGQAQRAASVAARILDYRSAIMNEMLEPEFMGGTVPLDMTLFKRLLSTTRLPGTEKDRIVTYGPADSHHLVVIRNGRLYAFDAVNRTGTRMSVTGLAQQFNRIIAMADAGEAGDPVLLLTALERPRWAEVREKLVANPTNATTLDVIDRAIFLVCLDDEAPETLNEIARQALCGAPGARWFDKSLQVLVDKRGRVSFLMEHSPADGTHFLSLIEYAISAYDVSQGVEGALTDITPLTWSLTTDDRNAIDQANEGFQALTQNLDLKLHRFDGFGTDYIKAQRISPDGVVQMAIQLAYIRLHGGSAKTYESAQTRQFRLGRTETIRSCSTEAVAFAKAMDGSASNEEKIQKLRAATEEHRLRSREACNGEGVDRHLLGLKLIAAEQGILPLPALLEAPVFKQGWVLSTSQVPAKHNIVPGFGPVCEEGYGIGYCIKPDRIYLHVTAKRSAPKTDAGELATALERALIDMRLLFDAAAVTSI